jgi:manganese/zinc/iron transport system permease protein
MNADLVIVLTALLVSSAAALLGSFLVLRRAAMMADAISHSVLPGIVLAFALSGGEKATLPALAGAAAAGLITVFVSEWLVQTGKVKNDAAIGTVFPLMFSLGVLGVSLAFRNVHLDLDAVLYGEIAYAPFNILEVGGTQWGPESLWLMGGVLIINALFVTLFYKELKLSTFDRGLAGALGFAPTALHYALMSLVSVTSVGAFQSVGAILIVTFMIVPPATAYLLTERLTVMVVLAVLVGAVSSLLGYGLAIVLDASIAGCMASVAGVLFVIALLFSPKAGVLIVASRRAQQRLEFATRHHDRPVPDTEILEEFGWSQGFLRNVRDRALGAAWVRLEPGGLRLTESGLGTAQLRPS